MEISGYYDQKRNINFFEKCDCFSATVGTDEICLISSDGRIMGKIIDYAMVPNMVINDAQAPFLAVVSSCEGVTVFADISSSTHNFYFTQVGDVVYYSTSLRRLLLMSNVEREPDLFSARCFLLNGFVLGEKTLFKNVFKLKIGNILTISRYSVNQEKCNFALRNERAGLVDSIRRSIVGQLSDAENVAMPLSGGFDSNLILDTIRKERENQSIHAYTIGGVVGNNEIPVVEKNVSTMENVHLSKAVIDNSFFDNYADIVWRLEGSVYEVGIFLQYALAKCVKENSDNVLVCGECADQVLNRYYYRSFMRTISEKAKPNERFMLYSDPFLFSSQIIMKKSALLLDSYGISGKYPFLDRSVLDSAYAVRRKNGLKKKYYKKKCMELFDDQIKSTICKVGGATSNQALLSEEEYQKLKLFLDKDEMAQRISKYDIGAFVSVRTRMFQLYWNISRVWDSLITIGLSGTAKLVHSSKMNKGMNYELKLLYLVLFYEMFASGKYNQQFVNEKAPIRTTDIFLL